MDIAAGQIQGARHRQEDAFVVEPVAGGHLLVIGDGLGGHPHGDMASRKGVARFVSAFVEQQAVIDASPSIALRFAAMAADQYLKDLQTQEPALFSMATTLVALYLAADRCWHLSVGDSYLLRLRARRVRQLNVLHSAGSAVTSCVGFHLAQVDVGTAMPLRPGDRYLLATDGIATLEPKQIARIVAGAPDADTCVRDLLRAVEAAAFERQDNVTLVAAFLPPSSDSA
jgi:PPM family protein phosphatase